MSKIIELRAENVKRLRAVSIKPDGSLVVIGGRNGQGKTSLLDAIMMAIGGKDTAPAEPLRRGEKHGEVEVTLDDGMVIKRTFTPNGGGTLTVSNKDGAKYGSPQKLLDGLVGKLSFDPLGFSRMPPDKQAQTLRELVGLNFAELDAKRKAAYDKRTEVGREIKRVEGALASLPVVPTDTPDDPVSVVELSTELEKRRAHNAELGEKGRKLEALRLRAVALKKQIAELTEELAKTTEDGRALAADLKTLTVADDAAVVEQIRNAETINAAVRTKREASRLRLERDAKTVTEAELSETIELADKTKNEQLAACKMPIDGLSFDAAGVTLNGLPLEQSSSAEQLRASVAIGLAMHPKLKVLLVRDGSLLDEDSLRMVAEMAAAADAQVWLERVSNGSECSVIIEDGNIHTAAKQKAEQCELPTRDPGQD